MSEAARRVLMAAHSDLPGGAENCLQTTLANLDRARCEVNVVFPGGGAMAQTARELGYEVIHSECCRWLYFDRNWWYWKNLGGRMLPNVVRLVRLIRSLAVDLVYTNTSAIFESALAARWAGVPHVWHVHEVLKNGNRMNQLLPLVVMKRLIYRLSERIVFESHAARRVFEESTPGDKSVVIYNSTRLEPPTNAAKERAEARRRFEIPADACLVGYIGQLIDRKNPLLLARAIATANGAAPVWGLFAGDGPLRGELVRTIKSEGLSARCVVVPFQEDIRPVLSALDILVLPSRQESFGLVLVEAGTYSKPVIACRCEGPNEIIVDDETGILVGQDDSTELTAAISRLGADEHLRARMGAAGARRVAELFEPKKNTRRLEELLEEVIANHRSHGQTKRPVSAKVGAE